MSPRFIAIDEEGYLFSGGTRLVDEAFGREVLQNIRLENRAFLTQFGPETFIVEPFDSPLVALSIDQNGPTSLQRGQLWRAHLPYGLVSAFDPMTITMDDWDRFHFRNAQGIPILLNRNAQMQFFELVDEFDDESVTIKQNRIVIPHENTTPEPVSDAKFWSEKYSTWSTSGEAPGWDLNAPAKPLVEVLPQIKIPRSRIAVLGCGSGHDANYFAAQGHLVTGFDFSADAITRARSLYPETGHLKFEQADILKLGRDWWGRFDIVFEHTFFCAIDPSRRTEAAQIFSRLLAENGHFLGLFFVMDKTGGPPFGASEWEVRERLKGSFDFLYWTRWHTSIPGRLGKELVVYAKKK